MQRIAFGFLLAFPLTLMIGCAGDGGGRKPPGPIYATQKPQKLPDYIPDLNPKPQVAQPKPSQQPVPVVQPPEVRTNLDTAALTPRGGIRRGRWGVIVVHHSESPKSTPQGIDSWHKQRGWQGLGYHLLIGNGIGYPDGQVFVGFRWKNQGTGAHTAAGAGKYFGTRRPANYFNENGIGICLIGNFEDSAPTPRQMATLQQLTAYLCAQAGIPPTRIYGHGEVTGKTQCPGRLMQGRIAGLRQGVARAIAYEGSAEQPDIEFALANGAAEFEAGFSGHDACCGGSGLHDHIAPTANAQRHGTTLVAGCSAERPDIGGGAVHDALDDVVDRNLCSSGRAAFGNIYHDQTCAHAGVHLHPLP